MCKLCTLREQRYKCLPKISSSNHSNFLLVPFKPATTFLDQSKYSCARCSVQFTGVAFSRSRRLYSLSASFTNFALGLKQKREIITKLTFLILKTTTSRQFQKV